MTRRPEPLATVPGARVEPDVKDCDLVLGGGGVRGIAHVGALSAVEQADLRVRHVAGASAGAIVGALAVAGVPSVRMQTLLQDLDVGAFAFSDLVGGARSAPGVGALLDRLGFDGPDALGWLEDVLAEHGVRTFGDLRDGDTSSDPCRGWRLVVRALDVANRRVVRLPWDYRDYGLDPDEQSVAQAVRASMSVPLVFRPVVLHSLAESHPSGVLVDGGMGGGVPVRIFDRPGVLPRWPTFGVRLVAVPADREPSDLSSPIGLLRAVIDTLLEATDPLEQALAPDDARTVALDTLGLRTMDVRRLDEMAPRLMANGRRAMAAFLEGFSFEGWKDAYRSA